jgi:hypothetical protein
LRLQRYFVSGAQFGKLESKYSRLISKLGCSSFSVFTGTPGENRKIVIEVNDKGCTKFFIKVPTSQSSKALVEKEVDNLRFLETFNFNSFISPKVISESDDAMAISNIRPKSVIMDDSFSSKHFDVLSELYQVSASSSEVSQVGVILASRADIETLNCLEFSPKNPIAPMIVRIKPALNALALILQKEERVFTAISHGDFTPWNIYVTSERLYIYDWEMADNSTPLLFDFFHYNFQKSVLIDRKCFGDIKREISSYLSNKALLSILNKYRIDINTYYGYYLMRIVSYYSLKYFHQDKLHAQAHWLLDVWEEALNDYAEKNGSVF